MNLSSIKNINELMNQHGVRFSKSLGQNFICDPNVCPKMASFCSSPGILEIGPGVGVLTKELAKIGEKVVSVELDKKLIPILNEVFSEVKNVKIIHGDILKTDLKELLNREFAEFKSVDVCSNLPYYITTPVIMKILESDLKVNSLIFMVQKEVAERICAPVGTRETSAVSIAVRFYSEPRILFKVTKRCFYPAPKVDSAVIKIDLKKQNISKVEKDSFFKIVKILFSKRRKTILNSLSSGFGLPKDEVRKILKKINLKENLRAEELSMEDFHSISSVNFKIDRKSIDSI